MAVVIVIMIKVDKKGQMAFYIFRNTPTTLPSKVILSLIIIGSIYLFSGCIYMVRLFESLTAFHRQLMQQQYHHYWQCFAL